ncbi:hypothetical protein F5H01DRAFT_293286, partial [Linnemannia elongata]
MDRLTNFQQPTIWNRSTPPLQLDSNWRRPTFFLLFPLDFPTAFFIFVYFLISRSCAEDLLVVLVFFFLFLFLLMMHTVDNPHPHPSFFAFSFFHLVSHSVFLVIPCIRSFFSSRKTSVPTLFFFFLFFNEFLGILNLLPHRIEMKNNKKVKKFQE